MPQFRKIPSESAVIDWVKSGEFQLPPLRFQITRQETVTGRNSRWDFEMRAQWGDQTARFTVEYKPSSTPRTLATAISLCRTRALPRDCYPLILAPYLRPEQLDELERLQISAVDLCGNGVVIIPNRLRVYRTGARNQFTTSVPIKNIYRGNTSLVARLFLTVPQYGSLREIQQEINDRNVLATAGIAPPLSLGTVSKAVQQLEDDLILERSAGGFRLLQGDKLLDQLQQNDGPSRTTARVRLKVNCPFERLPRWIAQQGGPEGSVWMATGLSSVARYATMQREEMLSLYTTNLAELQQRLDARQTDRFANLELIETREPPLYFSAVDDDGFRWAPAVQTYLELMRGDKRDRETAAQVRDAILKATVKVAV
ncbi:MAG: hypothetical protein EHM42_15275 [Planctomycetaceae bacterium]|nr:MAG: hypothetical protein EHM42_15275 [Planctomycetaceae bacterium]